jgi:hypothetical protein
MIGLIRYFCLEMQNYFARFFKIFADVKRNINNLQNRRKWLLSDINT